MYRSLVGIAVVIFAALASIGCATDGDWSVRKLIGWDDPKTPPIPNFPKASFQIAERVETLGNLIVAQNTLIGIKPLFYTIGVPESVLFHRGPEELFISEGLVKLCKSDAELAAVLCSELGQMVAEKKAGRRVGADRDSIPDVGLPGGSQVMTGGGTPDDPGRRAELGYQDRRPKPTPAIDPVDAAKLARTLLGTAGFDPATVDQVQPLLKQSDRGVNIRKQMSGSAPTPTWTW
ncbi:MAG TPA: hypothetical protein VG122_12580 [Gemmata sp.]|jgi:hypothetical protein|nr:hypothetical protein [Gemmata sp.]